jgi:formylglycine-generating enzyme
VNSFNEIVNDKMKESLNIEDVLFPVWCRAYHVRCSVLLLFLLSGAGLPSLAKNPPNGMALIPAGVYHPFYRAPNDPKETRVKAFYLDVFPVSNREFLEFVRVNPRWQRSQVKRIFADESYLKNWAGDLDPGTNAPANAPVTCVSWFVAKAYAKWQGKRLPTVAEWEYAAAASATQPDAEDDPAFKREVLQWYLAPAPARLPPVDNGPANFWGVRDLHGLVWEWVADFSTAIVTSDTGLNRQLYCAGAAQDATDVGDYAAFMRYAFRSSLQADYCLHDLGFRCAKDL